MTSEEIRLVRAHIDRITAQRNKALKASESHRRRAWRAERRLRRPPDWERIAERHLVREVTALRGENMVLRKRNENLRGKNYQLRKSLDVAREKAAVYKTLDAVNRRKRRDSSTQEGVDNKTQRKRAKKAA